MFASSLIYSFFNTQNIVLLSTEGYKSNRPSFIWHIPTHNYLELGYGLLYSTGALNSAINLPLSTNYSVLLKRSDPVFGISASSSLKQVVWLDNLYYLLDLTFYDIVNKIAHLST